MSIPRKSSFGVSLKECASCPELLDEIITELLGSEADITRDGSVAVYRRHNGNLREALREMYDLFAGKGLSEQRNLPYEPPPEL